MSDHEQRTSCPNFCQMLFVSSCDFRPCVCVCHNNKQRKWKCTFNCTRERERTIKIFHSPPIILFIDRQNKTQALKKTPQPTDRSVFELHARHSAPGTTVVTLRQHQPPSLPQHISSNRLICHWPDRNIHNGFEHTCGKILTESCFLKCSLA